MKKILAMLLCINFIGLQAVYALEDEFVNSTLDKNLKIQTAKTPFYEDETALLLNQNLKVKPVTYKSIKNDMLPTIKDETIYASGSKVDHFDFENLDRTIIKLTVKDYVTTKNLSEGEFIDFVVVEDVKTANYTIAKNTPAKARVELISMNQAYGVPANLTIDNFVIDSKIKAQGQITKTGANRSLWVYPLGIGFSVFFLLGPICFFPIRGGHAKLLPGKTYEVYIQNPNAL